MASLSISKTTQLACPAQSCASRSASISASFGRHPHPYRSPSSLRQSVADHCWDRREKPPLQEAPRRAPTVENLPSLCEAQLIIFGRPPPSLPPARSR